MQAVIPFPDIGPELFTIPLGGIDFALRWYALAYIAGIVLGWRLGVALMRRPGLWPKDTPPLTPKQVEDLITALVIGIILGGRLGYVLFYQPGYYLENPGQILAVWEGGMSFHGGALGVLLAGLYTVWRHRVPPLQLADAITVCTPIGLFLGRVANFVNAELWGHPTTVPWAVIFPGAAAQDCGPEWLTVCARHPSQLYEAGLEGLVLGTILILIAFRGGLRRPGLAAGVFFIGYGLARAFVELFRQADAQYITPDNPLGHVIRFTDTVGLSMGQALSLPMVAVGAVMVWNALRRRA